MNESELRAGIATLKKRIQRLEKELRWAAQPRWVGAALTLATVNANHCPIEHAPSAPWVLYTD